MKCVIMTSDIFLGKIQSHVNFTKCLNGIFKKVDEMDVYGRFEVLSV